MKRLSRTHETEIRGRIHIFLTKIFSICHKSGISKKLNEKDYTFEEDEQEGNRELPYSLYKNFWILQQFLNQPDQVRLGIT